MYTKIDKKIYKKNPIRRTLSASTESNQISTLDGQILD